MAMILLEILLLLFLLKNVQSSENAIALPGCLNKCGEIPIPYPFGIGPGCSLSDDFSVRCDTSSWLFNRKKIGTPIPYLRDFEILNISLPLSQARLNIPIFSRCYNTTTKKDQYSQWEINTVGTPLWLNNEKNNFIVTGCNTFATLTLYGLIGHYSQGCLSTCHIIDSLNKYGPSCSGIGCCQTSILKGKATKSLAITFDERYNHSLLYNSRRCSHAMVVENAVFVFNTTSITTNEQLIDNTVPAVFDWVIENTTCEDAQTNKSSYACKSSSSVCLNSASGQGYFCRCSDGYQGNPYLEGGCQDIDECAVQNPCLKPSKCHNFPGDYRCFCSFGRRHNSDNICELDLTLVLGLAITLGFNISVIMRLLYFSILKSIKLFKKRKQEKLKHKCFIRNGGMLLQHRILGYTIFTLDELEKATNRFDKALILGRGGYGEVYKGTLSDQSVVAIKRSKNFDLREIDQFINEVAILSQVRHQNVVKFIGCCLEAEVPLLVFEFISNRTFYDHLHDGESCSLTWKQRLRIALDAAIAIDHCHSDLTIPLIHRDVKSSNILLDDNFTAKVSDFGASRSLQIDQTSVSTVIQGTFGYLDPEYYHTGRLTKKSDVYSFGVILAELLTRQKPIFSSSIFEGGSLVGYFGSALNENRLFEILDPQVVDEGNTTELEAVAKLVGKCLRMNGEERPTMRKVVEQLSTLWGSNKQQKRYKNKNWWRHGKRIVAQLAKRGEES